MGNFFLVQLLEILVPIVAILVFGRVLMAYFKWKSESARRESEERNDGHVRRLAELEERIKVLERIVTDEQFDVKQRFRNL